MYPFLNRQLLRLVNTFTGDTSNCSTWGRGRQKAGLHTQIDFVCATQGFGVDRVWEERSLRVQGKRRRRWLEKKKIVMTQPRPALPLFLPAAPHLVPAPEFVTGHRLLLGDVGRLRPPTLVPTGPIMTVLPKFLAMTLNIRNNIKFHTLLIIHNYMATYL